MREWLEPMGLRGAIRVSNAPLYQELARRIGLPRMREAIERLHYGNEQIGGDVTTFWLRGPLEIRAVEQTRFLPRLAHQRLPFPIAAQQQVAEITRVDSVPGWSLHAKTGWQNAPGADLLWLQRDSEGPRMEDNPPELDAFVRLQDEGMRFEEADERCPAEQGQESLDQARHPGPFRRPLP